MSLNTQIADLFANFAALLELRGENVFKVIAFQKVSRIIGEMSIDLKKCVEEGTAGNIEGIGKSSQQIIEEFIQTGKSSAFEEVAATVPAGLVPMLSIEGMGPKTIHLLWKERNITSIDELEKAIASGSLAGLKGVGAKKIEAMKAGIATQHARTAGGGPVRLGIGDCQEPAEELLSAVRKIPGIKRAEIAGSLRRRRETIGDLDIVAAVADGADPGALGQAFTKLPQVIDTVAGGESKVSVKIANGMQADLRMVPPESFGAAWLYFTGSKDHNVKIRALAQKKGMTLNEWGLYRLEDYDKAEKQTAHAPAAKAVAGKDEPGIYKALGMAYVEPEMREDRGEVDAALAGKLPKLICRADIRGDLHAHTTASDGQASIEEMAEAARALGYEYLAITDHSKAMAMAQGLTVERLRLHIKEIHGISAKLKGITLLAGSEVDILADGRLDYEDEVLKELDIVIASPHVSLKQDSAKATDRLLRAIENRYVHIIGHPTGRLINRRAGLPLDMARLIKAAAETGTVLEINASYPRLDLDENNARAAIAAGVMLSIDTDAHSTGELNQLPFGLGVARRAWVTSKNVINCLPLSDLRKWLGRKR